MAQNLRILVVLPMYGGSLPIGEYCASALRDLGHSVRVFEAPLFYSAFTALKELALAPDQTARLENSFLQVVGQAIWAQVEGFEPHLVLAMAQAPMSRLLLQKIRSAKIKTAMWFVEDYAIFQYWQSYAPLYDLFAVIQKEPFFDLLKEVGQEKVIYLPLAALPKVHQPLELTEAEKQEYGASISFFGAGYPNRRLAFHALANRDFKIWGCDWDGEDILAKNIQRGGIRIDAKESIKIANASTINLNLHSSLKSDQLVSHGDFVNPRTFELASMGAFQLIDKRSLLPELFAEDELATFSTLEEMYQKIDYFSTHAEERQQYCAKARARVLKEHTYQQRMQSLLDAFEEYFGPWADTQSVEMSIVPESLQAELVPLLANLGLGPNANFLDVSDALRRRSGELSEIETALLFLDEWRKQY